MIDLIKPALLGNLREHAAWVAEHFPINFKLCGLDPIDITPTIDMDIIEIEDD